jgi:uncharacterized protein (DUF4415 family)
MMSAYKCREMRVDSTNLNKNGRIKMAKASRSATASSKTRQAVPAKNRGRTAAAKPQVLARAAPEPARAGWATDLVFDVREPKLAVSLRLDADVLRFFRGFGAGYQTRINEVLKAFMQARGGAESAGPAVLGARAARTSAGNGKRAR